MACMYSMLHLQYVQSLPLILMCPSSLLPSILTPLPPPHPTPSSSPHSLLLTPLPPPHSTPSSSPTPSSSLHSLLLTPLPPPHSTPSSSLHSLLLNPFCSMHSSTSGSLFLPCRAVWLSGGVDGSWYDHINSTVPHRNCSVDCNLFLLSWGQI